MTRIYWDPSSWPSTVFELRRFPGGTRVAFTPELEALILKYGEPGVLRGYDHRGVAFQEVRQLDFGALPRLDERDRKTLMRLIHTPECVMIHASGQKVSQPITGHWVRLDEADFERLSRMKILGEVNA